MAEVDKGPEVRKWMGPIPTHCDICGSQLKGHFVDGATTLEGSNGAWGIMCMSCFTLDGVGLGMGRGQKYQLPGGEKVAG